MMNKIEIPLSQKKILLALCGSFVFIIIGIFIIISNFYNVRFVDVSWFYQDIIKGITIFCILFFSLTAIYAIRKLLDKNFGLVIDENGIFENSNALSIGLIKWTDITEFKFSSVHTVNFIMIYTQNPDFYIAKKKGLKRRFMKINYRMYGSPISITCNNLKCKISFLERVLNDKLNEHRDKMNNV